MEPEAWVLLIMLGVGLIASVESAIERFKPLPLEEDQRNPMPPDAADQRGMKSQGPLIRDSTVEAIVRAIRVRDMHFSVPGQRARLRVIVMGEGKRVFGVNYQGFRYVEQDPSKRSPEAERCRKGASIVWIIKTHNSSTPILPRGIVVGRVEDNTVWMR